MNDEAENSQSVWTKDGGKIKGTAVRMPSGLV